MKEVKDYVCVTAIIVLAVSCFFMVSSLVWASSIRLIYSSEHYDMVVVVAAIRIAMAFVLVVALIYGLLVISGIDDKINYYLSVGRFVESARETILNAPVVTIGEYRVTVKLAKDFYSVIEGEEACLLARGKEKIHVRATIFYDKDGNKIYIKPIEIVTNPTKRAS